ncbi:uncharacterized protein LOC128987475 [Macrosteles quadrilineatus]|uniref:uncharacterized protein LOC128987475 n=1 Tax=Macrosteles quadrilineatus TaxID=74068 RepID=UPI0023E323CE|nr:uncharacterized protein LOC128987475 [Macrosteles quadrilineatus]
MRPYLSLVFLAVVAVAQCKRPPWYKPCWIYMCGLDLTDPVCTWDPHHGARIFRNDCERARHNFCYNRNYGVVDTENTIDEDIKLCKKLKNIVSNADDETSVIQDENVRVHFLEDPNFKRKYQEKKYERLEQERRARYDKMFDRSSSDISSLEYRRH